MAGPITINVSYLNDRVREFSNDENDSSDRLNSFNWQATHGESVQATLSADLPISAGASSFTPGKDLVTHANAVRANFATRLSQFNEQVGFLRSGLQSLLTDSSNIESLNTMSASDFTSYVKETTSGGSSSTSGSSGSGPGSGGGSSGSASGGA